MERSGEASILELAKSIAEGTTVESPDFEASLADIERFTTAWKTRSVLLSEHLVSASRCLLGGAPANPEAVSQGPSAASQAGTLESLSLAASQCVTGEREAANILRTARKVREALLSCQEPTPTGTEGQATESFTDTWRRFEETGRSARSASSGETITERNRDKVRRLVEGGTMQSASADSLSDPSLAATQQASPDPIVGDSTAPTYVAADWEPDASRIRCPVSGVVMQQPFRNRDCQHSYEKQSIEQLIRAHNRLRARERLTDRHAAPCPVAGCVATVSIVSLEPDTELMLVIERLQRRQERLQNRPMSWGPTECTDSRDPIEDSPR